MARDPRYDVLFEPVTAIGDAYAPSAIAAAVYAGHRYARELDAPRPEGIVLTLRERALV